MTLNIEPEIEAEKKRRDARLRKRLQRERERAAKARVKEARARMEREFPELLEIALEYGALVSERCNRDIKECEDESILEEFEVWQKWESELTTKRDIS